MLTYKKGANSVILQKVARDSFNSWFLMFVFKIVGDERVEWLRENLSDCLHRAEGFVRKFDENFATVPTFEKFVAVTRGWCLLFNNNLIANSAIEFLLFVNL